MATSQSFLYQDMSTYANYFGWASAVSANFAAFGWAQSTDTGQVMWTGMTVSAVSMSGTTATITYASLTGLPLAVGRALTFTGLTNAGNNKTLVITAFTGTTSGTITVTNASGVTESGSSGVVTAQTTAPGSAATFYEIWTPNDGLTNFFVRMEYGSIQSTNSPVFRITISTTTNGAGTATGFILGPQTTWSTGNTNPALLPYECDFSGAAGRFGAMMWRNSGVGQLFAIERSINSSGAYTSSYVTLWTIGGTNGGATPYSQRTLVFASGPGPVFPAFTSSTGGWAVRCANTTFGTANSLAYSNTVPFDTPAPVVGSFDYPSTVVGVGSYSDFAEGVSVTMTLYGNTRTYLVSKMNPFDISPLNLAGGTPQCIGLRYD